MCRVETVWQVLALAVLAACAAGSTADPGGATGFGAGSTSYLDRADGDAGPGPAADEDPTVAAILARTAAVEPGDAAAVRPAEPDDALQRRERELRNGLVGPERVTAALELAALLCELERQREAATVLEQVRRKSPDPVLSVALAGVRRDLGQRHLAVAELRRLRSEEGALALHPGLLFELAELEWLEGDAVAARQTLGELRRVHADDAWCRDNDPELKALARELETASRPRRVAMRDLLGNLRGAPVAATRLATLEEIVAMIRRPDAAPGVRALEPTVLAIAAGDASATVRARAIQLGPPPAADRPAFFALALADGDPFVRGIAARRAAELLGTEAAPWLLDRLELEADATAFAVLDAALSALAGDGASDATLPIADPSARAQLVATWRERREGLGW